MTIKKKYRFFFSDILHVFKVIILEFLLYNKFYFHFIFSELASHSYLSRHFQVFWRRESLATVCRMLWRRAETKSISCIWIDRNTPSLVFEWPTTPSESTGDNAWFLEFLKCKGFWEKSSEYSAFLEMKP